MSFSRILIGMLGPCLLSSILFVFAFEGLFTFSQCLLASIGIFLIVNCAISLVMSRYLVVQLPTISLGDILNSDNSDLNNEDKDDD